MNGNFPVVNPRLSFPNRRQKPSGSIESVTPPLEKTELQAHCIESQQPEKADAAIADSLQFAQSGD